MYINDQNVAEQQIKTQPGKFGLGGVGISVGKGSYEAVSRAYQQAFPFTGGTIAHVIVDVSGEQYRNLEQELQAMYARD